jgi:hypothetical protein
MHAIRLGSGESNRRKSTGRRIKMRESRMRRSGGVARKREWK